MQACNKTVWVTGASGGIGSAVARVFAQNGYRVALHYHTQQQAAAQLAQEIQAQGHVAKAYAADLSKRGECETAHAKMIAELGDVDVLVHCAGTAQQKLFCDIDDDDYAHMMDSNVHSAFLCCQTVLPEMIRQKQGKIILISSMWGTVGASCEVHYSMAKAAVNGLAKALAKELAPSNIQVNAIAPGVIQTPMHVALPQETQRLLLEESPMGRFGTPKEVAALALFLASESADFITGQVIGIDGGFI